MPTFVLDSSALVKRYHRERGSAAVETLMMDSGNRLIVSRLALVEIHSVFARLVREKILTAADYRNLSMLIEADVACGLLTVMAMSGRRAENAVEFLGSHGLLVNVRTLDAIHLVSALALQSRRPTSVFVAADKKLISAASVCGLPTSEID